MTALRPRLLFLSHTLPYPPDGGVNIRTFHVLRELAEEFDVQALCFYRAAMRRDVAAVADSVSALQRYASVQAFPIPQEHSRSRLVWDHVRSIATRRPYTDYLYRSSSYSALLDELLRRETFRIVHVDSLDLVYYLPRLLRLPVACTHHNVESNLLARRAAAEPSLPVRWYVEHQARLTAKAEREWVGRVNLNIVVSTDDGRALRQMVPDAAIGVVPNGVDTRSFRPAGDSPDGVVFVGGYGWYPNRDGMEYFARAILPVLRRSRPNLPVTWVGRAPDDIMRRYSMLHDVTLTGYVDDIRPHVLGSACYIVPLRVGGGTRLKILDAWAMGKAVVSTSIGCAGLEAVDGENILIRDDPVEFAEAVDAVLGDAELRLRLGAAARKTAESRYDWRSIGERLRCMYRDLLA